MSGGALTLANEQSLGNKGEAIFTPHGIQKP